MNRLKCHVLPIHVTVTAWRRSAGMDNQLCTVIYIHTLHTNRCTSVQTITTTSWTGPTMNKHYLHKWLNLVKAHPTLQVFWDWPGGMKENATALLLTRLPRSSYAHWKKCPSNARTVSTRVMVAVCSVRVWTVYTAPRKAVPRTSPLSTVPLCIHSGAIPVSLCLQVRVSWSEHSPPRSSRETLKAAVKCRAKQSICERCISVNGAKYVRIYSTVYIGIAKTACAILLSINMCKYNQTTLDKTDWQVTLMPSDVHDVYWKKNLTTSYWPWPECHPAHFHSVTVMKVTV